MLSEPHDSQAPLYTFCFFPFNFTGETASAAQRKYVYLSCIIPEESFFIVWFWVSEICDPHKYIFYVVGTGSQAFSD